MEKFYSESMSKHEMEEMAVYKRYKAGSCKNSCFAGGGHRVGMMPLYRLNDGGLPGVVCQVICLECGKKFKETGFYPKKEPIKDIPYTEVNKVV